MDILSYQLGKKAGGGGEEPTLIEKSITANGTYNASSDNADGYSKVNVSVQPNLQNKQVTINSNTTTTIQKDNNYDGLGTVEIVTNVSGGGGLDWTALGYSGIPQEIIDGYNYGKTIYNNWQDVSSLLSKYATDTQLVFMPKVVSTNATTVQNMFYLCHRLISIDLSGFNDANLSNISGMFNGCTALKEIDMSNFYGASLTKTSNLFNNCLSLTKIDIRNLRLTQITNTSYYTAMFGNSSAQGVPDDCLIIVKDNDTKTWITSKFSRLTNVKTVQEYEAS